MASHWLSQHCDTLYTVQPQPTHTTKADLKKKKHLYPPQNNCTHDENYHGHDYIRFDLNVKKQWQKVTLLVITFS